MLSVQTACFQSYVIFIAEGEILCILGESSENVMNNVEKFILIGSRMSAFGLI
jgi:hypothetical protein